MWGAPRTANDPAVQPPLRRWVTVFCCLVAAALVVELGGQSPTVFVVGETVWRRPLCLRTKRPYPQRRGAERSPFGPGFPRRKTLTAGPAQHGSSSVLTVRMAPVQADRPAEAPPTPVDGVAAEPGVRRLKEHERPCGSVRVLPPPGPEVS